MIYRYDVINLVQLLYRPYSPLHCPSPSLTLAPAVEYSNPSGFIETRM